MKYIYNIGNANNELQGSSLQQIRAATTVISSTHPSESVEVERKVDNPIYGEPETVIIHGVYSVVPFDRQGQPPKN